MKQKFLNVIPECYVDTNLIESLIGADVNHQHSCTKVIGILNKQLKDKFAIGIIDKDKVQLGYIKECEVLASTDHLILMKHRLRNQYLITVSPAADRFILDCTVSEGIKMEDYNLPSDLKEFIKVTKCVTSNRDTRLRNLFKILSKNREFRNLRLSLDYMVKNGYNTDSEELIRLFTAP